MGNICMSLDSRQLEQKKKKKSVQYTYKLVKADNLKNENKDFHFQLLNLSLTHFCCFGQTTNHFKKWFQYKNRDPRFSKPSSLKLHLKVFLKITEGVYLSLICKLKFSLKIGLHFLQILDFIM